MRRVVTTILFCSTAMVGCSSEIDFNDVKSMSEGVIGDLVASATTSGRCEDAELESNLTWQQYKDRIVAFWNSKEGNSDPEVTESMYLGLEANFADIYSQTPPNGQANFASSACETYLEFLHPGEPGALIESPVLLWNGYNTCLMGPAATTPVESALAESGWDLDPQSKAEMDLITVDFLEATAHLQPASDSAFRYLCPQIEHNPPDPDRDEKIAALRIEVDARARELGVCGVVDGGAPLPQRVLVHSGKMDCSDAEELILTGLERTRIEQADSAAVDGGGCSVVFPGNVSLSEDYDSDSDFRFVCRLDNGVVVGLVGPAE